MDKFILTNKKVWNGRVLPPTYPPKINDLKLKETLKKDTFCCTQITGLR